MEQQDERQIMFLGRERLQLHQRSMENQNDSEDWKLNRDRNWGQEEIRRLSVFLRDHKESFFDYKARKAAKIYKTMSNAIQTRNANQCRTFIKKMLKKFTSINGILNFFNDIQQVSKESLDEKSREQLKQSKLYPIEESNGVMNQCIFQKQQQNIKQGPTGVSYEPEQQEPKIVSRRSIFQIKSLSRINDDKKSQPFLVPSFMSLPHPDNNYFFNDNYPLFSFESIPYDSPKPCKRNTEHLWTQCHEMFIDWTTTLDRLMDRQIYRN